MSAPVRIIARTRPAALAILGQPVAHSLSPVFQRAALDAAGLDVSYSRLDVSADGLDAALEECRIAHCGGNITMPHKAAVFARAAHCTPVAARARAVNTFWWEDGRLIGHNTDVAGITATIRALCGEGIDGDVVLLGAGGSAAAALVALDHAPRDGGGRVVILARTPRRAAALIADVGVDAQVAMAPADVNWRRVRLVINATPAGMQPTDFLPLPLAVLPARSAVFDLVYTRDTTRWVREARERGHAAEDGLRMLVEQGAAAFEAWFGAEAPRAAMWHALGVPMPAVDAPRP